MPLTGEGLEALVDLATRYLDNREAEAAAAKRKNGVREQILALLRAGGEREVTAGNYHIVLDARTRDSIPVDLARQILPAEYLAALLQHEDSVVLNVRYVRPTAGL